MEKLEPDQGEIVPFKSIILFTCLFIIPAYAWGSPATLTPPRTVGVDFAIPFIVSAGGNSVNDTDHKNMGLRLQHFTSNNLAFGARFSVDIEEDSGRFKRWVIAPGLIYQWFQGQAWMPYIRTDIPVIVHGALNNQASDKKTDVGFLGGFGVAWNIGNAMGIPNMLLSYDFSIRYFFGFGSAISNFGIEFARFGLEYRF
ncbi:MAG: hypothetical protein R3A45_07190 [Bdellovibrionota bacterium]